MKNKLVVVSVLAAAFALFAGGTVAQHAQAPANPPAAPGQATMGGGTMGSGMMGGMMGGGMGDGGQMNDHQQMSTLMNKLMESMAAIQNEKDPAAREAKLAEHRALLEQMRAQMGQQGGMMNGFSGQIQQYCPMSGAGLTAPPK